MPTGSGHPGPGCVVLRFDPGARRWSTCHSPITKVAALSLKGDECQVQPAAHSTGPPSLRRRRQSADCRHRQRVRHADGQLRFQTQSWSASWRTSVSDDGGHAWVSSRLAVISRAAWVTVTATSLAVNPELPAARLDQCVQRPGEPALDDQPVAEPLAP